MGAHPRRAGGVKSANSELPASGHSLFATLYSLSWPQLFLYFSWQAWQFEPTALKASANASLPLAAASAAALASATIFNEIALRPALSEKASGPALVSPLSLPSGKRSKTTALS